MRVEIAIFTFGGGGGGVLHASVSSKYDKT